MANICDNSMFVESTNRNNIETVINFFKSHEIDYSLDDGGDCLDIYFDSKWTFPEELMKELFETIPNKEDIYIRCLSVEYGCMYHALWYCDESGWHEA